MTSRTEGRLGGALVLDGVKTWGVPHVSMKVTAASLNLPMKTISVSLWVWVNQFKPRAGLVGFVQDNSVESAGWALYSESMSSPGWVRVGQINSSAA